MTVTWCGCDEALYEKALDLEEVVMNATRERFACSHRNNPTGGPEFSRVCVVDGEVVSHIRIYERDYRVGSTPVHGGGIGDVCTHPDHRKKGYGAGCLRDAVDYFKDHGYHMSMILSGVFGFYLSEHWEKFPQHSYAVPPEVKAPRAKRGVYSVRWMEMDTDDLEQCMDVYNAYCENKSLSVVRSALYWRRRSRWQAGESPGTWLVAERGNRIVGYARALGSEMCMLPGEEDSALALYHALVRHARQRRMEKLSFRPLSDNPLTAVFANSAKAELVTRETCLLRFINLRKVLETILDELQLRWIRSGLRWEGGFQFNARGARMRAALTVKARQLSVTGSGGRDAVPLSMNHSDIFKLITGYGNLEDLPLGDLKKQDRQALAALFPRGDVVFWSTDTV